MEFGENYLWDSLSRVGWYFFCDSVLVGSTVIGVLVLSKLFEHVRHFHFYGELIEGKNHSYFEMMDKDGKGKVNQEEMKAGYETMKAQSTEPISAEIFSELHCLDEEIALTKFGNCLKTMEAERGRQ